MRDSAKKKVKKLVVFADAGHAWCRVRRSEKLFQKVADVISNCSYVPFLINQIILINEITY